jgi:Ca2+-binding EF-hand superfamily protein
VRHSSASAHGKGHAAIVCAAVQVDIESQELQDMIAEFDRDGDGAINEEEFKAIVTAMDD